jgi:tetratricopeptide (TPR) repeat protein
VPDRPGECPPSPPRVCFGRDELIDKIVCLAESFTPIALIGAGGIGKTSIALTVLHHDRIKQRFGDNCRFIRCDSFPTSRNHFLSRLSQVIGAGVENPEDLTPLRPYLSSKDMIIVLDGTECILDPHLTDAEEIYAVVEELSQLDNICLCITSRISTIPPDYEFLEIPTLSIEAARDTFYRIYENDEQSDLVDNILGQLDFHPLSITLLATVAHQDKWGTDRLTREWKKRRTGVLQARHSKSLAATIELSLASHLFQELGPNARALLGVIAFFPHGIDENNLDWLFPGVPNIINVFDNFCVLSLTHRSNGFITMLAPLRDYFCPKDPNSSPLLCATKECYFARLSVDLDPDEPGLEEARWITSEDVNIEHLLDVFTSIDMYSGDLWDACCHFIGHLRRHKPRPIVLGPKIEGLPDDHPSKPQCLFELSQLFRSIGHLVEPKQLLIHTLELYRERGDAFQVAQTLAHLADANRRLGLYEEGIVQAKEAMQIHERFGDTVEQARNLCQLAWLLHDDKQLDTAEEAASRATNLLPDRGEQFLACQCHRALGSIYHSKGETERAVQHFEVALKVASSFNWDTELFWIHSALASLFFGGDRFDDAQAHAEQAKSHAVNNAYLLGRAMELQATLWYRQHRHEEAKSEALRALDIYEKLGASYDIENFREIIRWIDQGIMGRPAGLQSGLEFRGEPPEAPKLVRSLKRREFLETVLFVGLIDSSCSVRRR